MKALFLVFHGFSAHNGISKKIVYQVEALRSCGVQTELCSLEINNMGHCRIVDGKIIANYGEGIMAKIKKRISYREVTNYVKDNDIDLLYIRSAHNANPFITHMLKELHTVGVKIVMEIPTYPYEGQFKGAPLKNRLRLLLDMMCRHRMAHYIDKIVTFSTDMEIFGRETINISNGIDFSQVKLKRTTLSSQFHMIAVAELHYWHAYDRILEGLKEYSGDNIIFHIVGDEKTTEGLKLRALTEKYNLGNRVIFHGALAGEKLDEIFDMAHFGIASLGRHRSEITNIKTLKNREYAARGLAFIYSETDDDFEDMPYIIKAPADDSAIDIDEIVNFYNSLIISPQEIRATVKNLSWEVQMKKVIDNV